MAGRTEPEPAESGSIDRATHRCAIDDERNVDREFAVARNELARAVERIDEDEAPAANGNVARGSRFFGNDGDVGQACDEPVENEFLGGFVSGRDGARIRLVPHDDLTAVIDHDLGAGGEHQLAEELGESFEIRRQRGCNRAVGHC